MLKKTASPNSAMSPKLRLVGAPAIIKKSILRLVRFRVETITVDSELSIEEERTFLNNVVEYFRLNSIDIIIPASNNTIFRTFPDGAYAAPYGSYIIDLSLPEDALWRNIQRVMRQNINSARKKGVKIKSGIEYN